MWVSAAVAQLVERVLGKDEVTGSNPVSSFRGVSALTGATLANAAGERQLPACASRRQWRR